MSPVPRTEEVVSRLADPGCGVDTYVSSLTDTFDEIVLPLAGSLVKQSESTWKIVVPKLSFFDVWLQPVGLCHARCGAGLRGADAARCAHPRKGFL